MWAAQTLSLCGALLFLLALLLLARWARAGPEPRKRKRKRKAKRKKARSDGGDDSRERPVKEEEEGCVNPFSSFSSVTQRRIKQKYALLVRPNRESGLTVAQVGQFAKCLIEARNNLQHKSVTIQRKFTITKALLHKADKSSFGRLCRQICKLETEQKRLEEDALVYNRLQEQLKLSPAFRTMLEISAQMESKVNQEKQMKAIESDISEISFEELLAQEKKDSFWQRHKLRSCVN